MSRDDQWVLVSDGTVCSSGSTVLWAVPDMSQGTRNNIRSLKTARRCGQLSIMRFIHFFKIASRNRQSNVDENREES